MGTPKSDRNARLSGGCLVEHGSGDLWLIDPALSAGELERLLSAVAANMPKKLVIDLFPLSLNGVADNQNVSFKTNSSMLEPLRTWSMVTSDGDG